MKARALVLLGLAACDPYAAWPDPEDVVAAVERRLAAKGG